MNSSGRIKVLLVDDHPVVRLGLGLLIRSQDELELVGEAESGGAAIALFNAAVPDVTLVDLSLPDMTGINLIIALKGIRPAARFVVLTANFGGNDIQMALDAGAHGYLFKTGPAHELLDAIRTTAKGGAYIPLTVGRKAKEARQHSLTDRELEVVRWVARGYSNAQIAAEMGLAEATVKYHLKNLMGKLDLASRSKVAAFALKTALVKAEDL